MQAKEISVKKKSLLLAVALLLMSGMSFSAELSKELYQSNLNVIQALSRVHALQSKGISKNAVLKKAVDSLKNKMKDPDSVKIRELKIVKYQGGEIICGEFNAKNSYGAYVGYKRFIAGGEVAQVEENQPEMIYAIRVVCDKISEPNFD